MSPATVSVTEGKLVGIWARLFVIALLGLAAVAVVSPVGLGGVSTSCRSDGATAARDCTIRGVITGEYRYVSATDDVVTKWSGTMVLRLASKGDDRRYVVSAGSSVSWSISGAEGGGCTVSGGGTLPAADLVGQLSVDRIVRAGVLVPVEVIVKRKKVKTNRVRLVRPGVWEWSMHVDNRQPRNGEKLMPVTESCAGSAPGVRDIAVGFTKGFQFADTGLGSQPAVTTDGARFAGSRDNGTDTKMSWNLKGPVFADAISGHGIQFIKVWEGWEKKAYNDGVGNCTIGYGALLHTGECTAADKKLEWTKAQADAALPGTVHQDKYQGQIVAVSRAYGLNQCQFDALMSFVYNTGGVFGLTQKLPLNGWEVTIAERLPHYVTATNNAKSKTVTKADKNGNVTFTDPKTGKPIPLPPGAKITVGANGQATITFTDPQTGKTYTLPVPTTDTKRQTLAGLVQRRGAELRLFTTPCPCGGVAGKTPSTVGKP